MRTRKEQIVDTAITLFNEHGTRPVTTNHITQALGISPGNLYYHFRSKEAIIRAIYERAIAEYDEFWSDAAQITPDPPTMLHLLDGVFSHQWKYRCLQREFPVLVRQDVQLAARYREMQERRVAFSRFLFRHWAETGSLTPLAAGELDDLVTATWLVGESWLGYLEAMGKGADEVEVKRGARLVFTLLRPYLTESAVGLIEASARAS